MMRIGKNGKPPIGEDIETKPAGPGTQEKKLDGTGGDPNDTIRELRSDNKKLRSDNKKLAAQIDGQNEAIKKLKSKLNKK